MTDYYFSVFDIFSREIDESNDCHKIGDIMLSCISQMKVNNCRRIFNVNLSLYLCLSAFILEKIYVYQCCHGCRNFSKLSLVMFFYIICLFNEFVNKILTSMTSAEKRTNVPTDTLHRFYVLVISNYDLI